MPNNEELLDDSYESEYEVPNDGDDYEEYEDEPSVSPTNRPQSQLQRQLQEANAKVEDLNKRLGDAIRTGGERLKKKQEEVEEWLDRIEAWQETELEAQYLKGVEDGVAQVERSLLPRLMSEDKVSYLEERRLAPRTQAPKQSPRPTQPQNARNRRNSSDADEDVNELIEQFTAQGVPVDQFTGQTSAAAVGRVGTKYLMDNIRDLASKVESFESKLDGRIRESRGDQRMSTGTGGASQRAVTRQSDENRLRDINEQLKKFKGRGNADRAVPLLREKREIETRLRRPRQ